MIIILMTTISKFMACRLRVRNDDHCPICRVPFVSFHSSFDNAYSKLLSDLDPENKDFERNKIKLAKGKSIWIDEWVRRSNGDRYQIIELSSSVKYNLNDLDTGCLKSDISNKNIKYMLLRIKIRTQLDCPNNVRYYVSFYETIDQIYSETLLSKFPQIENYVSFLTNLEPVWINLNSDLNLDKIDPSGGDFFQIIEIDSVTGDSLNKYCPQLLQLRY